MRTSPRQEDAGGAGGPGSDAGSPDDAGTDAAAQGAIEGGAQDAGGGAGALPYMIGIKTNGVPTGPATVESWLGRPTDLAGTTITTTSYIGSGTPYTTASGAHPLLECSFPLLSIFGESNGLSDMAKAASGAYDATYEAMAEALASWANPLLSVRIGWELNGNWYKWSNGVGTNATYANFVSAFKRAAALVKKAQSARPHPVEPRVGAARSHALLARRVRRQHQPRRRRRRIDGLLSSQYFAVQ